MKISAMKQCFCAVIALQYLLIGESFADWMTKDFCDRELVVGQVRKLFSEENKLFKIDSHTSNCANRLS